MVHGYGFEAASIQAFVFASNRLRETVGASELVEQLTGELLDTALAATRTTGAVRFSRRAGGAFFAFFDDAAGCDRFAVLWPLLVQQHAPGLAFDVMRGSGATEAAAAHAARQASSAGRNRLRLSLPAAGPFVLRNQRTGLPAVARRGHDQEEVDAPTSRKLDLSDGRVLARRCWPGDDLVWPLRLSRSDDGAAGDVMPYAGEKQWLALLHADGNSLGALFIGLSETWGERADYRERFENVSNAIKQATEQAVQRAVAEVLAPAARRHDGVFPARPIILGGDDLTMLLRADLAMPFTEKFLAAFEEESATRFSALRDLGYDALPSSLTACAGLAYMDAHSPFYLAYDLAAGLCETAKKRAKRVEPVPSALSFHRVTTSFIPDAEDLFAHEMVTTADERRFSPTMEVYALREGIAGLPSIGSLRSLSEWIDGVEGARGRFRTVLNDVASANVAVAEKRYRRWKEIASQDERAQFATRLQATAGGGDACEELPYVATEGTYRTPLGDALALSVVEQTD